MITPFEQTPQKFFRKNVFSVKRYLESAWHPCSSYLIVLFPQESVGWLRVKIHALSFVRVGRFDFLHKPLPIFYWHNIRISIKKSFFKVPYKWHYLKKRKRA